MVDAAASRSLNLEVSPIPTVPDRPHRDLAPRLLYALLALSELARMVTLWARQDYSCLTPQRLPIVKLGDHSILAVPPQGSWTVV